MDFNSKTSQRIKLKKLFKTNDLLFLCHSAKSDLNQWIQIEQSLKKLKLKYAKFLNSTTLTLFESSIYKNLNSIICGFLLFIRPEYRTTQIDLDYIRRIFKPLFELVSVKLNNKVYSSSQLKGLKSFSHRKNMFNLHQSLDRYLKVTYKLTEKR